MNCSQAGLLVVALGVRYFIGSYLGRFSSWYNSSRSVSASREAISDLREALI